MNGKLLICADLSDESLEILKKNLLKIKLDLYEEIHLVHAFQIQSYTANFTYVTYPATADYNELRGSIKEVLEKFAKDIFTKETLIKVQTNCTISKTPKESILDYVKDNEIDEMIIATRNQTGIAGFFASSFAEFMLRHADCVLRIFRMPKSS